MLQQKIDEQVEFFHVLPVGNGYVDCICPIENTAKFIDEITKIGVRITGFTWWCFVTKEHEPCGMGGPKNIYGDGWYSEIAMTSTLSFATNESVKSYLLTVWPSEKDYMPCFVPAFWLDVPTGWTNKHYTELAEEE